MQQLLKGRNELQKAGKIIRIAGYSTVLVVRGSHFQRELSFLKGLDVHTYIKKGQNVTFSEAENVYQQFCSSGIEAVIAIGGGSVIDLAKAMIHKCIDAGSQVPFFIAVPTTTGSGSEATQFAAVYDNDKKHSLEHAFLQPQVVILDPILTETLTPYIVACSGIDTLSQAVESYWSIHSNEISKKHSLHAISLWKDHFMDGVENVHPGRERLLCAAYESGQAISITKTCGPHALSYYLTSKFNIVHGQAVGLFLPLFFLYNNSDQVLLNELGYEDSQNAFDGIRSFMKRAGLATTLQEFELNKDEIADAILDSVNHERFSNNPRPFNREELKQLITDNL